jgi:hypothetical protein
MCVNKRNSEKDFNFIKDFRIKEISVNRFPYIDFCIDFRIINFRINCFRIVCQ